MVCGKCNLWYDPLIPPSEHGHYFWTNFYLRQMQTENTITRRFDRGIAERKGFDLSKYKGVDKRLMLRDITEPELGKHILECAMNPLQTTFL